MWRRRESNPPHGALFHTTELGLDGERIRAVYRVVNPDKLQRLQREAVHLV
jgi:hypothetical protein